MLYLGINITFNFLLNLFMQFSEIFLLILALLIVLGYVFLYLLPKRKVERFAARARQLGYKVKLWPFRFLGFVLVDLLQQDHKSLDVFKTELTEYDITVGNMVTNLAIIPSHPQILKDLFNQMTKLQKNTYYSGVFRELQGGGIPFNEGEVWRRKRRIISAVFHFDFLNTMIPTIEAQTEIQFKNLDQKIKINQDINVLKSFSKIASAVVAKCFFGTDANQYKVGDLSFCEFYISSLSELSLYTQSFENIAFGMKLFKHGLTPRSRKLKQKVDILLSVVREITDKQLTKIKKGQQKSTNLLTTLYEKNMLTEGDDTDPDKCTPEEFMGEFFAFFGAGTDTTSNTVNVALHHLSSKPEYIDKIREELQLLDQNPDLSGQQKLKNMKWVDAVFNEALRMGGPAAGIIPRVAVDEIKAGGLEIPKNTSVCVFPLTNDFTKEFFDRPDEFLPERWIDNPSPKPYTYIPFGAGERQCIGQYLARIQAKIILSKFIQRYTFKSKRPLKMMAEFIYATHGEFILEQKQ